MLHVSAIAITLFNTRLVSSVPPDPTRCCVQATLSRTDMQLPVALCQARSAPPNNALAPHREAHAALAFHAHRLLVVGWCAGLPPPPQMLPDSRCSDWQHPTPCILFRPRRSPFLAHPPVSGLPTLSLTIIVLGCHGNRCRRLSSRCPGNRWALSVGRDP